MDPATPERFAQQPSPDEGDPPHAERDPRHPTATAPDSVEESVPEEAEFAGTAGPDAADPPIAAGKHAAGDAAELGPVPGLDPEENADVRETREEAHEIARARDEQQDKDLGPFADAD